MVAQHAQRPHAILPRQAQVEQDAGIVVQAHGRVGVFGRPHPVHRMAGLLQADLRGAAQLRVVFGQQDAHGIEARRPAQSFFLIRPASAANGLCVAGATSADSRPAPRSASR